MSTATVPLEQRITPAAHEIGLAVINRVLPMYESAVPGFSDLELSHEIGRLEAQEHTVSVTTMLAALESERIERRLRRMGAGR